MISLIGCGPRTDPGNPTPQQGNAASKDKGDFSTPKAAVETFIAAAAARDADLLSRCIADTAPREFAKLRDRTASKEDLDGLAKLMRGGVITGVTADDGKGTAVVEVKLETRNERIRLTRATDGWKVVDF
jgi:hypothetical protein